MSAKPRIIMRAAILAGALLPLAANAGAQDRPAPAPADSGAVVTIVPGPQYAAGPLQRFLLGDNYRFLWTRPMTVQVLDLDRFAGGLAIERRGGNQTRTLHFEGEDGREYIFRSVDKFVRPTLHEDLQGTVIESIMQDFISMLHPGGAFVVAPLQRTLGLLTEPLTLRVMPDDPALGEHREDYAGLLGQVLEKSNEGEDDTPGTWGYTKIVGSEALLDNLEDHPRHRVHTRELLRAKLVDFLVGDTDRGLEDQWRWAREPVSTGYLWRPIARDRDWAFVNAEGPVAAVVRRTYDKIANYGPRHSPLQTYVWQDQGLSRRLLTDLEKGEWDAVVAEVQAALTDEAIEAAVRSLPPELQPGHAEWLAFTLRQRRDGLRAVADEYYAWLATEVDVYGTDEDDRLEVLRNADGSLDVTLYAPAEALVAVAGEEDNGASEERAAEDSRGAASLASAAPGEWLPYYSRRFQPHETREVRVYLQGGDDVAVVRGVGAARIRVRVIGGGGDDELVDAGSPSRRTALYDARGRNRIVPGPHTKVDTRRYQPPPEQEGWLDTKTQEDRIQDWGSSRSWLKPAVDYGEGAGIILGGGPTWTDYGFRKHPYASRIGARALFATRSGGFGVELFGDWRLENSPIHFTAEARATQFESMRFYGYGNDTPRLPSGDALIMQRQLRARPAVAVDGDGWHASAGPLLLYTDPRVPEANPAAAGVLGADDFGQIGAMLELDVDRTDHSAVPTRGFRLGAEISGFPGVWDAPGGFGRADAEARGYFRIPVATGPVIAVRAGAQRAWGAFPVHESARIGGLGSLRGYRWQRFAGDAALYGGAELRVPLARVELVTKGRLGVLGLADAGRVYLDGASPGGWHTGFGAGLWFATVGHAVNLVWARGEEDRFYLGLGLPF